MGCQGKETTTEGSGQDQASPSRKASVQAGMVQVAGVGMGLLGALFLAAIVFLATGRGSETEALGIFAAWALIFATLVWRASHWRQTVARGLAFLGAEALALPLAWLLYQGLPSLSRADPRLPQTLSVLAVGLPLAAALLVASVVLRLKGGGPALGRVWKALVAVAWILLVGEALYVLALLAVALVGQPEARIFHNVPPNPLVGGSR